MIEILNYERVNRNKVIGYVDIKLPKWNNMIIRHIAHIQGNDGNQWFNLPSFSYEDEEGVTKYKKYWEFETQVHNGQLLNSLNELVKKYCEDNHIEEIPTVQLEEPPFNFSEDLPF